MRVLTFAVALAFAFASGCASTPHAQAVQQTAAGAVLLSSAVGATLSTGTSIAVVAATGIDAPQYAPALMAAVVVTAVLYGVSGGLLLKGAAGLDAFGPVSPTSDAYADD